MAIVMSDNFSGTTGASFNGDAVYTNLAGTPPIYVSEPGYGQSLQFAAAAQSIIVESYTATTQRTFDRIYYLSGAATTAGVVLDVRTASASFAKILFTASNKLQIQNSAGTTLATSTNSLPVATRFRVAATLNGTVWKADLYADDTTNTILETITGTVTLTPVTLTRDGMSTATGFGSGISLRLIWPQDGDTATPGSRADNPPVANAGHDQTVRTGTTVMLDGSGSYDLDPADTLTYAWTHVSGPNSSLSNATVQQPTYTATQPGIDTWSLVVTDSRSVASSSVTVTITAKTAQIKIRRSGTWVSASTMVRRSGSWVPLD